MFKFLLVLALFSTPSFAQRALPDGIYAELDGYAPPVIRLNGKDYQTAPAVQIRDEQNRLMMPGQVPSKVAAWIQTEPARPDLVWRVWILGSDEVAYLKSIGRIQEPRLSLFGLECLFIQC